MVIKATANTRPGPAFKVTPKSGSESLSISKLYRNSRASEKYSAIRIARLKFRLKLVLDTGRARATRRPAVTAAAAGRVTGACLWRTFSCYRTTDIPLRIRIPSECHLPVAGHCGANLKPGNHRGPKSTASQCKKGTAFVTTTLFLTELLCAVFLERIVLRHVPSANEHTKRPVTKEKSKSAY